MFWPIRINFLSKVTVHVIVREEKKILGKSYETSFSSDVRI
jgi:hypothetical protein